MRDALRRAATTIRTWIRTNITGGADLSYTSAHAEAMTFDDKVRDTMERTEFLPAHTFTETGDVSKEAIKFWVGKLVEWIADLIVSGVTAGVGWMLVHWAHREEMPESGNREAVAKHLLPAAVWAVCFVILTVRRSLARPAK